MKTIRVSLLAICLLGFAGCNADLGPFQTLLNTCVFAGTCDGSF